MPQRRFVAALLIVLIGVVLHWPAGAGFKADDFPAISYASDLRNCLHDFVGPQYDLSFLRFYRPFITLSFGVDHALFGTEPFGYYAMNALALIASALLVFSICTRFDRSTRGVVFGFVLAILWIVHPIVVTSLRWVAGRVDSHVAVPMLLALWLHLGLRRGGRRWPVWVAAIVALGTKESAIGFPLMALGFDLVDPHPSLRKGPALFGRALPALPYLVLIPVFLLWRYLVLGTFMGGYGFLEQKTIDPISTLVGSRLMISASLAPDLWGWSTWIPVAFVTLGIAYWVATSKRQRAARFAGVLLIAAGLFGPLAQVLTAIRGDQRHAYLASVGVLAVWAGLAARLVERRLWLGVAIGLMPVIWLLPARIGQRATMDEHDAFNRSLVSAIREATLVIGPDGPIFVADEAELANHPYRMMWGLGSVHRPPFGSARDVVSLRKLHPACDSAMPFVTGQLNHWVEVRADGATVKSNARRRAARLAKPRGFSGTLEFADLARSAKLELFGYEVGEGFDGTVAVCSSLGSCLLQVPAQNGVLSLPHALIATNVTPKVAGDPLLLIHVLWNAMDLANDNSILLFWTESGQPVVAELRATREFVRAVAGY